MGGAERAERRRRRELAQQRAAMARQAGKTGSGSADAPRPPVDRARLRKVAFTVGGAAIVVALIVVAVLWFDARKNATEGRAIPVVRSAELPETRDGAVVVLGDDKAPVTIDIYADFLCPACGQFHERDGKDIANRIREGQLRVRQHMVPMLVEASDPPGYSMDAANAALCAADERKFTAFHDSLFASQPEEGTRGWDKAQLTELGRKLGLGETFAECVAKRTYHRELDQAFRTALKQIDDFATPAVIGPDGRIDVSKPGWLDRLG
ncbi:DsbA family protein [Thermocrispum agreste]|jgi:protein-disulfide isomerase|uniref:DsbA family protein n=1 Tax=Thermocrispum agreste TaxID=37925 RepID=UPI000417E3F4|nr:thioredoxin domain-containing protein [Thermocrispum agreste]